MVISFIQQPLNRFVKDLGSIIIENLEFEAKEGKKL
jgi:hypothetical protein